MESKIKLLKEFGKLINLLEKNNIWYSLEAGSLLGAVREGGMIAWDDDIDLAVTYEGYMKLKKLYPNNILDTDHPDYPLLFPKWIDDVSNFDGKQDNICIDLFLSVPTTKTKFKNFTKLKNKLRFSVETLNRTSFNKFSFALKVLTVVQWPLKLFFRKKMTIDEAFKMLNEPKNPEESIILVNPTDNFTNKIMSVDDGLTKIKFEGIDVSIVKDYDRTLKMRYGNSYMIPKTGKFVFKHTTAISVERKKIVR